MINSEMCKVHIYSDPTRISKIFEDKKGFGLTPLHISD